MVPFNFGFKGVWLRVQYTGQPEYMWEYLDDVQNKGECKLCTISFETDNDALCPLVNVARHLRESMEGAEARNCIWPRNETN